MDKGIFLQQNPGEVAWSQENRLLALEAKLTTLQTEVGGLGTAFAQREAPLDQEPPHPYGLCGDVECESCVQAAQMIRDATLADLEKALIAAMDGDPALKERFAQAVQVGQTKLRQGITAVVQ